MILSQFLVDVAAETTLIVVEVSRFYAKKGHTCVKKVFLMLCF